MSHNHTHEDFVATNKAFFDENAHQYDERPGALERARRVAAAMLKAYPFDEDTTSVMEFACGTGLVSRELAPYTKSILGVDISQGMVDQFNKRVENQGIPPEEMRAIAVELKGDSDDELGGAKFDVIVCASAYHHFTSIEDVTKTLAFFLKVGGSLLVADLEKMDAAQAEHVHHDHGFWQHQEYVKHIVPHRFGFEESDIRVAFEGAGLEFSYERAIQAKQHGNDVHLFLAKGIKPGGTH